jgi:hypothetical protein
MTISMLKTIEKLISQTSKNFQGRRDEELEEQYLIAYFVGVADGTFLSTTVSK